MSVATVYSGKHSFLSYCVYKHICMYVYIHILYIYGLHIRESVSSVMTKYLFNQGVTYNSY